MQLLLKKLNFALMMILLAPLLCLENKAAMQSTENETCKYTDLESISKGVFGIKKLIDCCQLPFKTDFGPVPDSKDDPAAPADNRDIYDKYKEQTQAGQLNEERYFILSVGPPASGKGINDKKHPIIDVDVDAFTMKYVDQKFFYHLKKAIKDVIELNESNGPNKVEKSLKPLLNAIGDLGFNQYKFAREKGDMEANYPMYSMFTRAENNPSARKHVIYETTLSSPNTLHWAIKVARLARRAGLTPVVVYPFVIRRSLYYRAMKRAEESGRLPAPNRVKRMAPETMRYALAIRRHMITTQNPDFRRFFLIDNTGEPEDARIVFDSHHVKIPLHFN